MEEFKWASEVSVVDACPHLDPWFFVRVWVEFVDHVELPRDKGDGKDEVERVALAYPTSGLEGCSVSGAELDDSTGVYVKVVPSVG